VFFLSPLIVRMSCVLQITHLHIHEAAFNGEHDDVEAFTLQEGVDIDIPDKVVLHYTLHACVDVRVCVCVSYHLLTYSLMCACVIAMRTLAMALALAVNV
jgi:hypothetical protein